VFTNGQFKFLTDMLDRSGATWGDQVGDLNKDDKMEHDAIHAV